MAKRYFIFVDESGNNDADDLFGLGCLLVPVDKIGEYHEILKSKSQQIFQAVRDQESHLQKTLQGEDLINFLKGRGKPYEIKFKHINSTTSERYKWFVSQYFKFSDVRFCCLVIDKKKSAPPPGMSHFDVYINQLSMLICNNLGLDDECIVLPDDISVPSGKNYETMLNKKLTDKSKKCLGIHRLESHSCVFLQVVDVLVGSVLYEFKENKKEEKNKVLDKIKEKLSVSKLNCKLTKHSPNYFSVWIYDRK